MSFKTIITIISIIIIIIGLGLIIGYYSKPVPTPPGPEDEISQLLKNLKQETGINFSEIGDVEFQWTVKVDPEIEEKNIQGKGFEVEKISDEQYRSIESFFKDKGFEIDVYNVAAGTISGLTGYQKNQTVCLVIGGVTGYKEATGQWIPPEPDKKDIEVRCGKIEKTEDVAQRDNF